MSLLSSRLLALLLAIAIVLSGCADPMVAEAGSSVASSSATGEPLSASSQEPAQSESADVPASSEAGAGVESEPEPEAEAEAETEQTAASQAASEMDLSVREAFGANGMVATASPVASKIGLSVLQKGGNAVDAAVAVAYGLGMAEPNASGVGGDGFMLVYDAKTKKTTFIDYKCECPAALTLELYKSLSSAQAKRTGISALVPGFVAGMEKANELFGTMSMEELIQPTIDFAEQGIEVTPFMATTYLDNYETLMLYPETSRIFLNDGFPYMNGEIFRNQDYADTLKLIVRDGAAGFYRGEIAQSIVDALAAEGGVMTLEDLANFTVRVTEPITTTYRGYTIMSCAPGSGGTAVLESLNMAENYDVQSMGHNSTELLHLWAEIFKLATVDRYSYVGDPLFADTDRMAALLNKGYAAERIKKISADRVLGKVTKGDVTDYEGADTTHVSIIDKDGNMVAMTNTVSDFFGCAITVQGRGFFMNNQTANLSKSYLVNQPAPGRKVRSSISPTFIFDAKGNPIATLGSPGAARIVTAVTQIVSNIVDFGMDIQTAINQPRIHQANTGNLYVEGHMDPDVIKGLKKIGHGVTVKGEMDFYFGGVQGVSRDPVTGLLHGAADPRRDGKALGY
jgi:gamma-glutamyltranspeptidase/glutathione hydrolase